VLPDGGYGNLIAAPLNGQRRKDGLTLFLDLGTLEPHEDQWAYLSTLDRLSVGAAARIARQASRQAVGSQVSTLSRSAATKVQPPMPAVIHADFGAGLILDTTDLPPAAVATFKHAASMANPKFYELQRLRKSTWDTPRFVRGYEVTVDDKLVLPRETVTAIVDASSSRLQVTDLRTSGTEIDVTLGAELRDVQADAVGAMLAHDDGVLVAPPGSGKTVMACALIAERATSTAVLVDRKALADQWRDRLSTHLGVKAGQLGGGRTKLTGIVDVVMLPSLARRRDVAEVLAGYGHVVVDECHHLAAAVYDHTVKKISARYWLGLTATPVRRDGLGDLVTWQLGPVRHAMDTAAPGTLLEMRMQDVAPSRVLHLHQTTFRADDIDLAAPGALAAVHRALATNTERNHHIVADVHTALGRGRNVLVLTRRVAHVQALVALLAEHGHQALVLQGGMPAKERRAVIEKLSEVKAGDSVLVVGTTPFIGEGFDAPALDTLFLAAPVSFDGLLVQCAGRVIRSHPGKNVAEVHDYHDAQTPVLAASLKRRMPGYRTLGFATR